MDNARLKDINNRYSKKSESAFRTYQETGRAIYDWFYREYADIAQIAYIAQEGNEYYNKYISLRVWMSEWLDRMENPACDMEKLRKDMIVYARTIGVR